MNQLSIFSSTLMLNLLINKHPKPLELSRNWLFLYFDTHFGSS